MNLRTGLFLILSLALTTGCPPLPPELITCEEADACETTGFASSDGGTPTTSGSVQTVTGDEDKLVVPFNSKVLSERIPGAALEVLPGVAHGVPLLDRDVVRRNVNAIRP